MMKEGYIPNCSVAVNYENNNRLGRTSDQLRHTSLKIGPTASNDNVYQAGISISGMQTALVLP